MAVDTNLSIFCSCGGLWVVKEDDEETKRVFVCPICGNHQPIPEDTSFYQIKL